ncbi:MAG: S9 family peptidase [Acidobacteria bacterium]|nr:S9 family peptidase [Acidobacteriota bacterium]
MRRKPLHLALTVTALMLFALSLSAQNKRAFSHQDFDSWKSIQAQQLSHDGKWVAYALMPQDGDGEIIVRNLASGAEWKTNRGYRPPQPPSDAGEPGAAPAFGQANRAVRPYFTADNRFVLFTIEPTKAELNQAKKDKKKPEEMPKNALAILDLSNGQVTRIEKVKSFQVPEDAAGWVAYQLEAKPEEKKPEADAPKPGDEVEDQQRGGGGRAGAAGGRPGNRKEYGSDLVLRNLTSGAERTFANALDYSFSKDAKTLVYTVSARKEELNGVFAAVPGSDSAPVELLAGKGKYARLTWDEDQTQLAFTSDRDDAAAKQPKLKIYHWTRNNKDNAVEIVSTSTANFRSGLVISDNANLSFSLDGNKLFLGVAPPSEPEKESGAEENGDDKVSVDLWHYKDDYIQPMQKVRATQERNRSYRAVFHLKEKKFVQLADETMNGLNPADKGQWAIGTDDREYRRLVGVDTNYSDVYLVNTNDGARKSLLKKNQFGVSWSPNGKYGLVFDGKDWHSISVPDGKMTNLTAKLGVNFWRVDHDSPSTAPAYGNGGWVKDDKYVLLYDEFDIWQVAPDGSSAKNLTDGVGRKEKIEFRYSRLDSEERFIDPAKPLLLSAENVETRDSGFYRDKLDGGLPEKLHWAAKNFTNPTKAKDADVLLLTASRFDEYPDLLVTNSNFKDLKKVSNVGEQLSKFNWGKAELVRFRNTDGVALSGILIKPDNFDPKKKYPMIVYLYEKLTNTLHSFTHPTPTNSINRYVYASNGYLVFMPDIVYTIGYPGESAMKCVLPGVQAVVDQGFVDENAIGIQGHSWGGYQIAYMLTQTNRFKAAAPGAVVVNMTSAYSGIRWGTGLSRQFQYEHTQSRIGGTLWEYPMRFLENSPLFRMDRVQTPILTIHNDADDAVPWYQGIEYYLALRRLGKEVYMFTYNGEPHNLRRRQNQKDYTRRMLEYFDHKLKGAPMPEWMEKGIPYLQREKEKEKYKPAAEVSQKSEN